MPDQEQRLPRAETAFIMLGGGAAVLLAVFGRANAVAAVSFLAVGILWAAFALARIVQGRRSPRLERLTVWLTIAIALPNIALLLFS